MFLRYPSVKFKIRKLNYNQSNYIKGFLSELKKIFSLSNNYSYLIDLKSISQANTSIKFIGFNKKMSLQQQKLHKYIIIDIKINNNPLVVNVAN